MRHDVAWFQNSNMMKMAPRRRFERPTCRLGGGCSILLSYRGMGIKWWSRGGSNSRPSHCERDALPAELRPQMMSKKTLAILAPAFVCGYGRQEDLAVFQALARLLRDWLWQVSPLAV